ncbi:MAG: DUF494 family protein [Bacteroidales bacterium]|nr:DUF494 family protein [Candidatus Latescibacterota bacterium]
MKERIKEIITYIMDLRTGDPFDMAFMYDELEDLGYSSDEIDQAFTILDFDGETGDIDSPSFVHNKNRILGEGEKIVLSIEAQGYLLRLRASGWLTEVQLSLIIENAAIDYQVPISVNEIIELTERYVPEIPDDILTGSGRPSDMLN